jgi:hypothetical protein
MTFPSSGSDGPDGKVFFIGDFSNATCDTDSDGIPNTFDLDSDNDGIYDAIEAGHNIPQTNGLIMGPYGVNGLSDLVETTPESGTINYTISNTDGTDPQDYLDLDSDDDGCNDVNEAGYTDDNSDGFLGPIPITVDGNGLVTSGIDGYTTPADADTNSTFDFQEAGLAPVITTQPPNTNVCPGCSTTIEVIASNADTYQWQLYNGSSWVDLTDSGIHNGTDTATLSITNASPSDNGNQYRVVVSNTLFVCEMVTSNSAILTVNVASVITNRRITFRVKKN